MKVNLLRNDKNESLPATGLLLESNTSPLTAFSADSMYANIDS